MARGRAGMAAAGLKTAERTRERTTSERTTAEEHDAVADVADTFHELMRSFVRARRQFLAKAKHDLEWSSRLLLSCVVREGPVRATTLAEHVQSDPSTVSRHIASLVKDGYLERLADPADGRVSLLVATDRAREAHREQLRVRNDHFRRMLDDWDERDVRRFATLLRRFTADYEKSRQSWFDDEPARDASRSASQRES